MSDLLHVLCNISIALDEFIIGRNLTSIRELQRRFFDFNKTVNDSFSVEERIRTSIDEILREFCNENLSSQSIVFNNNNKSVESKKNFVKNLLLKSRRKTFDYDADKLSAYGSSLRFVNRLLDLEFGVESSRKVT